MVKAEADLGVIFDTDCDRAAIVDRTGKEINRNRLIALISAILLDKKPGATIVTDSVNIAVKNLESYTSEEKPLIVVPLFNKSTNLEPYES